MTDLQAALAFLFLVAVPVIVASLTKVPMDEGHGTYTMSNRGYSSSRGGRKAA